MDQKEQLVLVLKITDAKMKLALSEENLEKAESGINFNLRNMKVLLYNEQYKKYLNILNISVNNENESLMAVR